MWVVANILRLSSKSLVGVISSMEKFGWIGTGKLGTAIVERLLTQNVPVLVFNRTYEKARPLVADGATLALSPREVAEECSTVFLCLTGHEALEEVIFANERGIVAAGTKPAGASPTIGGGYRVRATACRVEGDKPCPPPPNGHVASSI